jgi:type II secretory ATPase GspE/PulE/Tfp pilus assembly ATPase PilB-like protein
MTEAEEGILAALLARGWRPAGGTEAARVVAERSGTAPLTAPARGRRSVALAAWVDGGDLDPWWAAEALAAHFGLRAIARGADVPAEAGAVVMALPGAVRRLLSEAGMLPLRRLPSALELAVDNPLDEIALAGVAQRLATPVVPTVAPWSWIAEAWERLDGTNAVLQEVGNARGFASAENPADASSERELQTLEARAEWRNTPARVQPETSINLPSAVSIGDVVDTLFAEAIVSRASDIHLEPGETRIRVRHRVDGVLREAGEVGGAHAAAVLARTKLLAGLSIVERRLPQDGRFRWMSRRGPRNVRVSSVPTVRGESIVIRILEGDAEAGEAGGTLAGILGAGTREGWERLIRSSDGLLLVTGPTGSGKSSTLHASLRQLAEAGRKVITIEDPVERELPRVVQVGIRPELGLGFPEALRAVLRQSPEVIAVGEVRDRETARSCLNASLTGHLVFSTLHTSDAIGAIVRLRDLGASVPLLATALRGVLAQRLVRRTCRTCARPAPAPVRSAPCRACRGTGFSGRLAVAELLVVKDALRGLIRRGADADTLRTAARQAGMRTLVEDGASRVGDGCTTAGEICRVLGSAIA